LRLRGAQTVSSEYTQETTRKKGGNLRLLNLGVGYFRVGVS
jgi:hypothetical protein